MSDSEKTGLKRDLEEGEIIDGNEGTGERVNEDVECVNKDSGEKSSTGKRGKRAKKSHEDGERVNEDVERVNEDVERVNEDGGEKASLDKDGDVSDGSDGGGREELVLDENEIAFDNAQFEAERERARFSREQLESFQKNGTLHLVHLMGIDRKYLGPNEAICIQYGSSDPRPVARGVLLNSCDFFRRVTANGWADRAKIMIHGVEYDYIKVEPVDAFDENTFWFCLEWIFGERADIDEAAKDRIYVAADYLGISRLKPVTHVAIPPINSSLYPCFSCFSPTVCHLAVRFGQSKPSLTITLMEEHQNASAPNVSNRWPTILFLSPSLALHPF